MQLDRDARILLQGLLDDRSIAEVMHFTAKDNSEEAVKLGVPARFPSTFQLVVGSVDDRDPAKALILDLTADLVLPMLAKYLEANAVALQMAGVTLPPDEKEFDIPEQTFGGLMPGAIANLIEGALKEGKTGMAFRVSPEGKLEPVPDAELPAEVRERLGQTVQSHQGGWPTASTFMDGLTGKKTKD